MIKLNIKKGDRFNKLIVLKDLGLKNKNRIFLLKCDCGNEKIITLTSIRSGKTKSCGCIHKEQLIKRNTKHGKSNTRLYSIYRGMKNRCYNKKTPDYKFYGKKGIIICKEWLKNFNTFYNWAIKNGYKDNLTIDRINYNDNYKPNNCRWVSQKEQVKNMERNIKYKDECSSDASRRLGGKLTLVSGRVWRGWSLEKSFNTPLRLHKKYKKRKIINKLIKI